MPAWWDACAYKPSPIQKKISAVLSGEEVPVVLSGEEVPVVLGGEEVLQFSAVKRFCSSRR